MKKIRSGSLLKVSMMNFSIKAFIFMVIFSSSLNAFEPKEGDYLVKDFKFNDGETLPELKLHYTTLGAKKFDDKGQVTNAVLLLHGTTGTGKNFLNPSIADYLFGNGQPLDASKYYIIMPDGIGRGGSSKPSDGLRAKFPHYGYTDLVQAQYKLIKDGLGIDHLKLILGTSMGGMHGFLWAEHYPEMMDSLVLIASQPVAITGRNFFWRKAIMESIKNDPAYNNGDYTTKPNAYLNTLALFNIMTRTAASLETDGKTDTQATKTFDKWISEYSKSVDANDFLYGFSAISDYNPEPDLEKIQAKVLVINFADDLLNPIELGALERTMPQVKNGQYVIIDVGPNSLGHQNLTQAKLWAPYLSQFFK